MASNNSKHTEWILETIDHLRRRKARPDLERICHVVRRRHGLGASETEAKLEKLVDAEIVIKVDYKGSTSYRNAAKWRKSMLGCAVLNSTTVSIKIIEAIMELSKQRVKEMEKQQQQLGGGETPDQKSSQYDQVAVRKYATEVGVPLDGINGWLRTSCEGFDNLKSPLTVVLKREIDAGRVKRLLSCNYVITAAQMEEIGDDIRPLKTNRKIEGKSGASSSAGEPEGESAVSSVSEESNPSCEPKPSRPVDLSAASAPAVSSNPSVPPPQPQHQPARRGRPPKNRALVTPSQQPASSSSSSSAAATPASTAQQSGPGASTQSKLKRILSNDASSQPAGGPEPKSAKRSENKRGLSAELQRVCDFCQLTCLRNPKGEPELLLQCKDCTARAHPSCMNYSRLLASRACRGPWQCMDCKTCCLCQDSTDPDQMLFCDGCDKGYHMNCHQPPVNKKPSGKWECSECRLENISILRNESLAGVGNRHAPSQESAPLTPAESPVPGKHSMNNDIHLPTSPSYLGNGKYPDASSWSVSDVVDYLTSAGFKEESKVFQEQEIDGVALLLLKRADVLKGLDLKLGPALKINRHIQGLQTARQHLS